MTQNGKSHQAPNVKATAWRERTGNVAGRHGRKDLLGAAAHFTPYGFVANAALFALTMPLRGGTLDYQRIYPPD